MQAYVFKKTAENLVLFTVDELKNGEASGKLYHYYQKEPIEYAGLGSLMKEMDRFYNWLGFPVAGTNERTFRKSSNIPTRPHPKRERVVDREAMLENTGEIATFSVYVQHRENSTWQGELYWEEKDKCLRFSSELEFLKLMDSALRVMAEKITE